MDGNFGQNYTGVRARTPPNFTAKHNRAPTSNDYQYPQYMVGDEWEWQDAQRVWKLTAVLYTPEALSLQGTWKEITFNGANSFVTNAGTAIPVDGVLNVLGDTGIETAGAGNTITISTDGTVATTYHTDDGDAIPVAAQLNVYGGLNMNTAGAANVVTINLDTSILQPATTADALSGMYSLGTALNAGRFMYSYGPTNTFLGGASGNLTLTIGSSINNTGIGGNSLHSLSSSANNTAVGHNSLLQVATGNGNNVGVGSGALLSLVDGESNVCLGSGLGAINTGDFNISIGNGAGDAYLTSESSNILIGNAGVVTENNTLRIGTQGTGNGQQNSAYMAGIYAGALSTTNKVTMVDSTGKLAGSRGTDGQILIGATGGTGSPAWANITSTDGSILVTNGANSINLSSLSRIAFSAFCQPENNVTGDGTVFILGAVTAMNTSFSVGGGFFPGNGAGTPASFTAPITGIYQINFTLAAIVSTSGGTQMGWGYFVNGAGGIGVYNGPTRNMVTGLFGPAGRLEYSGGQAYSLTAGDVVTWFFVSAGGSKLDAADAGSVSGFLVA